MPINEQLALEDNYWFPYWGGLVIKSKVSKTFCLELLKKGETVKKEINKCNKKLAGAIDQEYAFLDSQSWFLPKFKKPLSHYEHMFNNGWQNTAPNIAKPFKVKHCNVWINYQKCREYNPRHAHGGDLSFVIYLKIPKELIAENTKTKSKFGNAGTGTIEFYNGEMLPFSICKFEEMPSEGDVYIFPAWMQHQVTPFFSNVERITVAGNLILEKGEKY